MGRRAAKGAAALIVALFTSGCWPGDAARTACRIIQPLTQLPDGLEETSGVAISRVHDGILWTHNDSGGDPEVVAVRANGQLVGRVQVEGARARDWEDLALGPCPSGMCLHVADTGDGTARRQEIGIYRFPEPEPADELSHPAEYFPARYPDGPRDAEALFVTGEGEFYLVSKGWAGPTELYRYPQPLRAGEVVTLEFVRTIAEGPLSLEEHQREFSTFGPAAQAAEEEIPDAIEESSAVANAPTDERIDSVRAAFIGTPASRNRRSSEPARASAAL